MQTRTLQYFESRFDALRARRSAELSRRPTTPQRELENWRNLAAINLMMADLYAELARTLVVDELSDTTVVNTYLEVSAFRDAARLRRIEAKQDRDLAASIERRLERERLARQSGGAS